LRATQPQLRDALQAIATLAHISSTAQQWLERLRRWNITSMI